MSLGITAQAKLPRMTREKLVETLGAAAGPIFGKLYPSLSAEYLGKAEDGVEHFHVKGYVAAAPIQVTREGQTLTIDAGTSSAGAGYHDAVIRWMDALAEQGFEWLPEDDEHLDETGYRTSRDFVALQAEMNRFASALAGLILSQANKGSDLAGQAIGMSIDPQYLADVGDAAKTSLGPRSAKWFKAASQDPAIASEFFAWPQQGVTAKNALRTALVNMWEHIGWTKPAPVEPVLSTQRHTLKLLTKAHKADPTLPFPWYEWKQLADLTPDASDLPAEVEKNAATKPKQLIGYRRGLVQYHVGAGVTVKVPGSLCPYDDPDDDPQDSPPFRLTSEDLWLSVSIVEFEGPFSPDDHAALNQPPSDEDSVIIDLRELFRKTRGPSRGIGHTWLNADLPEGKGTTPSEPNVRLTQARFQFPIPDRGTFGELVITMTMPPDDPGTWAEEVLQAFEFPSSEDQ